MNQYYNNGKLKTIEREDHRNVEDVLNHIFVADGKWTMHRKLTLRAEAQYMKSSLLRSVLCLELPRSPR